MELADCYRLLGLNFDAKPEQIKASYRRLARSYHPDANPDNPALAHVKFIQLTEAYQLLLQAAPQPPQPVTVPSTNIKPPPPPAPPPPPPNLPKLSPKDRQLKSSSYQTLQKLLAEKRFARAIALVEGLAYRFPLDAEIRQWQAIAYQQQGRQFIRDRAFYKAAVYLNKALRTDPHNRSLAAAIEKDFQLMRRSMKPG
ncbi:DnaJ domain-containing protein [Oscillatoria sp. FACHB-1406]|uniref:J domain-containing protein n=1 Tax=Oscillatoria sp. FACHB-1406 TaxID=2692846 RepID=UPI001683F78E|nr:DnaJ domain-containing protein [Oscillatoria sp. FACHB-1406]MBD2576307.1 J domain-containing protein [Oscillatoria sp. FACHB-1406]